MQWWVYEHKLQKSRLSNYEFSTISRFFHIYAHNVIASDHLLFAIGNCLIIICFIIIFGISDGEKLSHVLRTVIQYNVLVSNMFLFNLKPKCSTVCLWPLAIVSSWNYISSTKFLISPTELFCFVYFAYVRILQRFRYGGGCKKMLTKLKRYFWNRGLQITRH